MRNEMTSWIFLPFVAVVSYHRIVIYFHSLNLNNRRSYLAAQHDDNFLRDNPASGFHHRRGCLSPCNQKQPPNTLQRTQKRHSVSPLIYPCCVYCVVRADRGSDAFLVSHFPHMMTLSKHQLTHILSRKQGCQAISGASFVKVAPLTRRADIRIAIQRPWFVCVPTAMNSLAR